MQGTAIHTLTRRSFLHYSSLLGTAAFLGLEQLPDALADLEVRRVRLIHAPVECLAPQYLVEAMLRHEGFTEIEYVTAWNENGTFMDNVGAGRVDFSMDTVTGIIPALDAGVPVVALAGVHGGCYELMGRSRIRGILDLKGSSVGIIGFSAADHMFISSMAAYVGLHPQEDIDWVVTKGFNQSAEMFANGQVDAFLAFPPQPQALREKKIGHTILDTARDRPWSRYLCCMLAGNRNFVVKYPEATKRVLRAYLKAADICASDPERVATFLVQRGFDTSHARALEILRSIAYYRWREENVADTFRFHLVRLHEAGMLKRSLKDIVGQGIDLRFLAAVRRELKA